MPSAIRRAHDLAGHRLGFEEKDSSGPDNQVVDVACATRQRQSIDQRKVVWQLPCKYAFDVAFARKTRHQPCGAPPDGGPPVFTIVMIALVGDPQEHGHQSRREQRRPDDSPWAARHQEADSASQDGQPAPLDLRPVDSSATQDGDSRQAGCQPTVRRLDGASQGYDHDRGQRRPFQ